MSSNKQTWEYFGRKRPYFGVQTLPNLESDEIDEASRDRFFASGEEYVGRIWTLMERNFDLGPDGFRPGRSLDFGCGVGRLLIPIADRSDTAVGADISSSMLDEAKRNLTSQNIENASVVETSPNLSELYGKFDFIHSFVVFQHIDPNIGEKNFSKLVELLDDGGIGVIQVQIAWDTGSAFGETRHNLLARYPIIYRIRNMISGRSRSPLMPMHSYDLNKLFMILQTNGCHECLVRFSHHGVYGVLLLFQKRTSILF